MNDALVDAAAEGMLVELRRRSAIRRQRLLARFYRREASRVRGDRARSAGVLSAAANHGIVLSDDESSTRLRP